jgi:hypothetical protein
MLVDRRVLLGAASFAAITTILQPTRLFAQGSSPTRIGIIGSGNIGGTIGGLWVKKGHSVFFSSRHPDELKDMVAKLGSLAQAGTVEQAVAFGDVLFIAVPYGAIPQIGKDYSAAMKGKVMLDACNAVSSRDGARRGISRAYASCVHSTQCLTWSLHARRTDPIRNLRYQLPGTTRRPCRLRLRSCATPVSIRLPWERLPMRGAFSAVKRDMDSKSRPLS